MNIPLLWKTDGEWVRGQAVLRLGSLPDPDGPISLRLVSGELAYDMRLTPEQAQDLASQLLGLSRAQLRAAAGD